MVEHWPATHCFGGFFTTIVRADRMQEALAALPRAGVNIFPLWPRAGMAAKRVILQARKGSRSSYGPAGRPGAPRGRWPLHGRGRGCAA